MSSNRTAPRCFVIMPIGAPRSEIRERSGQVFSDIISPAVRAGGYEPVRADELPGAGIIMTEVIHHLANDPLVIADLTGANANVYYELAVRHSVRKPVLGLIQAGEGLPFDISSLRVLEYESDEQAKIDRAVERLTTLIHRVGDAGEGQVSPVSIALPDWRLTTSPGRIPAEFLETMINLMVDLTFRLASPALSPEPCSRCKQAHSHARQLEHLFDLLSRAVGIDGPSEIRDMAWRRLAIICQSGA